jgi:hypothetical protein
LPTAPAQVGQITLPAISKYVSAIGLLHAGQARAAGAARSTVSNCNAGALGGLSVSSPFMDLRV